MPEACTGVVAMFDDWYRAEYPRLVNSVALAVGDREVAADAAAEACTRALERWERVAVMDRPGGWVYRVALNEARRRMRRRAREREVLAGNRPPTPWEPPDPDDRLWTAVARLPERTRHAVVLRYVADLTEPEIADALGVRRGTVATLLRRARARLADELGPRAPSLTPPEVDHAVHR